jgi:YidC/Oxa1 family membrane protein insertase
MDRTAWIVVTLCTAGLIGWFWFAPKPPPRTAPAQEVVQAATPAAASATATAPTPTAPASPGAPEQTMSISDDGIDYVFSNIGGGIKTITLPPKRFSGLTPTVLNADGVAAVGALSQVTGLLETDAYELKSPPDRTPVVYERTTPEGLTIRKTWTPVTEGTGKGFLWNLALNFKNTGAGAHSASWSLYAGTATPLQSSEEPVSVCWNADGEPGQQNAGWFNGSGFLGMQFRAPAATFEKSFSQLLWGGVHSQYYTTLIAHTLPERELPPGRIWAQRKAVTLRPDNGSPHNTFAVYAGVGLPDLALAPGQEKSFDMEVFMGPRAHSLLAKLPRRLDDAMFYGMFGFISKPMLWLLTWFQDLMSFTTSSWGWAVILLTVLVRGLLWPLNLKATRQMKRMSLLAPQMKELQEKYKDDPQKMNAQVMGLYKKYGVNPVSGCLPMLLQIPIFFGLYTMLRFAVEMRGHGFLWVNDLALPDTQFHIGGFPINPLPLVMAGTMFIQMAMTPKSPDPNMQMQQRIFLFMPLLFLFMCYNFAAALALYWTVSNIIGIFQSWVVKRMPEPELVERPEGGPGGAGTAAARLPGGPTSGGGKPSFMEIFAERLAEQQKKAAARTLPGASPASKQSRPGGSGKSALRKPGEN